MKMQDMRWVLLLIAILLIMNPPLPKEAVADVEGQACTEAADCPCFGTYGDGTNYGIGVGSCTSGACDMTYCVDLQPMGEYVWSHIKDFTTNNLGWTLAIIGLLLMVIFWPKR